MDTFTTDSKRSEKKTTFESNVESIKLRLQQMIEQGRSKYEIAMELPDYMKNTEDIEEHVTRYFIRQHFEK